jgi:hypothetical protein
LSGRLCMMLSSARNYPRYRAECCCCNIDHLERTHGHCVPRWWQSCRNLGSILTAKHGEFLYGRRICGDVLRGVYTFLTNGLLLLSAL